MKHIHSIFKLALAACILGFFSVTSYGQQVSTLAGMSDDIDGDAKLATFASPNGVAVDPQGNLYVTDWANDKIRKITPQGIVSTLAGSGDRGDLDGIGTNAMFASPWGLTLDKDGNIFVAEYTGRKIRKVTQGGVVSTVAKSPSIGPQPFFQAKAIVVDASGNIYVADFAYVTKITPGGVVSIFAGAGYGFQDGPGTSAKFKDLTGIAIGADGNLYVADNGNDKIRKITPQGEVSTYAGSVSGSQNGNLSVATFNLPYGIAIDKEGNMYVSEESSSVIRKISKTGEVSTLAGQVGIRTSQDGPASSATFYRPQGLAVDNSGNVYVADNGNQKIRKISSEGIVSTVAGVGVIANDAAVDGNGTLARFNKPAGVATDVLGNVYIADKTRVRKITPAGNVSTLAGSANIGTFGEAAGIAVDATGNVFVSDILYNLIRKITPEGLVTTFSGSGNTGYADGSSNDARFNSPSALAFDASGNLYVTDQKNYCIRKITPNGAVTTFAGTNVSGYQDGNGTDARFNEPTGIAIDKAGNLYVVSGNRIRKITPQGEVSTFAGSASQGSVNGIGTNATFYSPTGICIDASDNLYVTQRGSASYSIRKITPSAVVTTLAGAGLVGTTNGPGATARFNYPAGIAADINYNIYIADQGNFLIRKITLHNEIKVLLNNNELISGSEVDFGTVKIGESSEVFTFSIENETGALKPLSLLGTPIITVSSNDFIVEQTNVITPVEVGTPATFTITFEPGTTGDKTATVTIVNNDLNESNYTFEIKGTTPSLPVATGIEEAKSAAVICYPNPASSQVTLNSPEEMLLEVYTSEGAKLMTQQVTKGENLVNIETLPAGLYLFNLPSIGQSIKVVKE